MSHRPWIGVVLGAVCFVAALIYLPLLASGGLVRAATDIMIASLFALSFNLAGEGGMLSFGHAAFFGVGAFGTVHAMQMAESTFPIPTPVLPLFGLLTGLSVGAVFGYFATKRSGVYFSMTTYAVAELLHSMAPRLSALFGGEAGLSSMRMPWMGFQFGTDTEVYYLILFWFLLGVLALYCYTLTPLGHVTLAVRENELRLKFLGYDARKTKLLIFTLSAGGSGLAGGLQAVTTEAANYIFFAIPVSAAVVLHTFVGGSRFLGPAVGATVMVGLGYALSDVTRLWPLYQGLIFIAVILFLPQGLAGVGSALPSLVRRARLREYRSAS